MAEGRAAQAGSQITSRGKTTVRYNPSRLEVGSKVGSKRDSHTPSKWRASSLNTGHSSIERLLDVTSWMLWD